MMTTAPRSLRVAVVCSASGSEREVSLASARNVGTALREYFDHVTVLPFDTELVTELKTWQADLVFPVAHGAGENGTLQALLETHGWPYVGSDAPSSALCWDKSLSNALIAAMLAQSGWSARHPGRAVVPAYIALTRQEDWHQRIAEFCSAQPDMHLLVIKPAREGSSCGVTFRTTPGYRLLSREEAILGASGGSVRDDRMQKILAAVANAFVLDELVLVQEAITGMEITVGVLDSGGLPMALPPIEISLPPNAWYDYQHKYAAGASQHIIPARLPADWLGQVQELAVLIHQWHSCRDLSRVDFIVEMDTQGEPLRLCYLETNTLPGFTDSSLLPEAAREAGISLPSLLKLLTDNAWRRADAQQ